jgi:hypothetical protein
MTEERSGHRLPLQKARFVCYYGGAFLSLMKNSSVPYSRAHNFASGE